MRLLVFTTQFPPAVGGVETMSWQLSKHLQSKGEDISILTQRIQGAEMFDASETLRIKRFQLDDPKTLIAKGRQKLALIQTLRQAVEEWQADCVLCTGWDPCAYIASIAFASSPRIPYFLIAHGMELMQLPRGFAARRTKAWMRRKALSGAKRIIAVSNFTRDRVIDLGVPRERVSVVPNGVAPAETQRNGCGSAKGNIVTTVSRLVPRKGQDTVLRAMPRLLEQVPDAIYRIVGTGPELLRLQALAQQLQLNGHVEFYGQVSDSERERLLNECNVFVLATRETPTDFEGLGIAVLEAMQKGKPVVVTRAGGVPEIVEHGRTGLVVEPDNPETLAGAMLELLRDPARACAMGSNAEVVVREKYGWDVIAGRYLDELKKSLEVS
jgi:phosphatidylinositol alpha-1,6-mannosyltransferase